MTETFTTYWTVNGERVDDLAEVERLVMAGAVAIEISAAKQRKRYERQQLLDKWARKRDEMAAKISAEQAHANSPEGRAEAARNQAAQHPGGIVTSGMSGFPELDAFGPNATNVFK